MKRELGPSGDHLPALANGARGRDARRPPLTRPCTSAAYRRRTTTAHPRLSATHCTPSRSCSPTSAAESPGAIGDRNRPLSEPLWPSQLTFRPPQFRCPSPVPGPSSGLPDTEEDRTPCLSKAPGSRSRLEAVPHQAAAPEPVLRRDRRRRRPDRHLPAPARPAARVQGHRPTPHALNRGPRPVTRFFLALHVLAAVLAAGPVTVATCRFRGSPPPAASASWAATG